MKVLSSLVHMSCQGGGSLLSAMKCVPPASLVRCCLLAIITQACVGLLKPDSGCAAPPRYDHVVIVVEENRTAGQIVGDLVNAPFITSLATGGVSMASMFAIEHPSQPNYFQLFSGTNQGVLDDNLPPNFSTLPTATFPFQTPNLAAELISAGFTFAGFSEQLEMAGTNDWADYDPHSATHPGIYYRRKHNPWANWVAKSFPIPSNQLATNINRAFSQFPSDFRQLPTVSFVVPNQLHDMHDGSRKEGDDWLRDNLSAYALWAKANNSLLIVTWDEDDYDEDNQIPTVFHGANLRNGTESAGTWTLHNLLRTLEDMYGLPNHAGAASDVRPIVGPFVTDPFVMVATFRQGLAGYSGARDTQLSQESPDSAFGSSLALSVDSDTSSSLPGSQQSQALIRFDDIFGSAPNQLPTNATIHSAKLLLHTPLNASGTDNDSDDTFGVHRMISSWSDAATWNSAVNGIGFDGVEAASAASFSAVPDVDGGPTIFDVTADIELFKAGTANRGWVVLPSSGASGDGWTFRSSENPSEPSLRPTLEIIYSLPTLNYAKWASMAGLAGGNDSPNGDPDGDGAINLTEFAYNLNPLVADARAFSPPGTNGLPSARYLSGGVIQVQYLRRKATTVSGISYSVQFSSDLITWSSNQTTAVSSLNGDWERVLVRDAMPGPNPRRFGRVIVTLQ